VAVASMAVVAVASTAVAVVSTAVAAAMVVVDTGKPTDFRRQRRSGCRVENPAAAFLF
jgi:hypothetical protein